MIDLSVVGAGLVLVMFADVEDVGVGLRDAAPHQVDVLHVALRLQLLVAPHKLQHRDPTRYSGSSIQHPRQILKGGFLWIFYFYVRYSTLLRLPPLRLNCVGGCWDRNQGCCDFSINSQTL